MTNSERIALAGAIEHEKGRLRNLYVRVSTWCEQTPTGGELDAIWSIDQAIQEVDAAARALREG